MGLSTDLISQFVKVTKDTKRTSEGTTVYGTVVLYKDSKWVRLDGSDQLTPMSTSVDAEPGERVSILIKDHKASVTGNFSSPAARTDTVKNVQADLVAETARIENLVSENVTIKGTLIANQAAIEDLQAENVTINGLLTAVNADIENLSVSKLDADTAKITYATIENLNATNADIYNLEAVYGRFEVLTTNRLDAAEAVIDSLDANYANIDFANIREAAVEKLFASSGIIKDLVMSGGYVTGELVGVTIKGDLIEANTIVANSLILQGTDGLYYRLNTNGEKVEASQTDYNSIHGSIITAQSITANKVNVDDLVAFDATIGGFNITDSAIYSGVKSSVDNTTSGIYLDKTGQVAFGDASSYIKYYKDTSDDTYKLDISAKSIKLSSSGTSEDVATSGMIDGVNDQLDTTNERITNTESLIQQLSDSIEMLVIDENGESLMTQNGSGWVFDMTTYNQTLSSVSSNLDALTNTVGGTQAAVDILNNEVFNDLSKLKDYIAITTYNGQPCIELGETDSGFKLRITNTEIQFIEGSSVPAYMTNQKLYITKAEILNEMKLGKFVWQIRTNGNLGLLWKG